MRRTWQSLIFIFAIVVLSSCVSTKESVEVEEYYLSIPGGHVTLIEPTDIDCYDKFWASDGSMIVHLHTDNGMPDLEIPIIKEKEWKDEITSPRMGRVTINTTIALPDTYPVGTIFTGNISGFFTCPVPEVPGFKVASKTVDQLPISVKIATQEEVNQAYWKSPTPYLIICCNGIFIIFVVMAVLEIIKKSKGNKKKEEDAVVK